MANPIAAAARRADTSAAVTAAPSTRSGIRASGGASYAGATGSRLTADWILASIKSADQEVRGDLRTLRARSRELIRNNDLASKYIGLVEDNVAGPEGITLQADVTRPDGRADDPINKRIEEAFARWSEREHCTVHGKLTWADVQSLLVRSVPQDGEALIRLLPFRGNPFGFALELLDPDQLDEEFDRPLGRDPAGGVRNEIRMGVEIDKWGRPVAYWPWTYHPSETGRMDARRRRRVPAEQIVHLYRENRVHQTRGIPWLAPALFKLKMTAGYEEAEVIAARIAAAKGGFFEQREDAVNLGDPDGVEEDPIRMEVEPGVFDQLPRGWTFKAWDPQHPTTAFADFHKAMVRGIANGVGVSYTSLANDLSDVNFSSIRAGLLAERDAWMRFQSWTIGQLHRRVYREWLKWALTTGELRLPDRNRDRWSRARWQPRRWPWVDPEKDMRANAMAIRLGLDSRTRLAKQQGRDFRDVLEELKREQELAEEMGVELSTDVSKAGAASTSREDAAAPTNRVAGLLTASANGNGRSHA